MIRWGLKYYIVQSIFEADIYHYFDAHGTMKIELFHNTVKIELFHNCGYSTDV